MAPTATTTTTTGPSVHPVVVRRQSQLIRLETIEERVDTPEGEEEEEEEKGPREGVGRSSPRSRLMSSHRISVLSESELFATPTGSITSLNDDDDTNSEQLFQESTV